MVRSDHGREHDQFPHFANWLDAFVSGKSTPATEPALEESSDAAEDRQLREAARQFHGLVSLADRQLGSSATTDRLDQIWEHVVATSGTATVATVGAIPDSNPERYRHAGRTTSSRIGQRWHSAINGVLAAVLILGLTFGIWKTFGNLNGGGSEEPTQLSALLNQEGTPENEPTPTVEMLGTPAPVAIEDLPAAEDCTVEPLTVDEVLEIVDFDTTIGRNSVYGLEGASAYVGSGAEDQPIDTRDTLNPETHNLVSGVLWEWNACVMADSWFQVWALMPAGSIRGMVTETLYPVYVTRDEGRVLLERVQAEGKAGNLQLPSVTWSLELGIELVDPDPANSRFADYPGAVRAGFLTYDTDGVLIAEAPVDSELYCQRHFTDIFRWSPVERRWLFTTEIPRG